MTLDRGSRWRRFANGRSWRALLVVAALVAGGLECRTASAWPCRWRAAHCGWGYRPFCGPVYGYGFGGWGGWGYSSYSYRSYSTWTPGFFSGWCAPWVVSSYPACGWYPCGPVIATPFVGCYPGFAAVYNPFPSSFAPVYGPAGVLPFMGFPFGGLAASGAPVGASLRAVAARPAVPAAQVAAAVPRGVPRVAALRPSNAVSRLRANRLLAVGDRHLRAAIADPAQLSAALDAYRRAATIAPDQPDTHLRQAIVLTALGREQDASAAVSRAVAIDARLGDDPPAALAAADRLPPDPVFGDAPMGGPSVLASRSATLIGRIFSDEEAAAPQVNWIADRWSSRFRNAVHAVASN